MDVKEYLMIELQHYILIATSIVALVPSIPLFQRYRKTGITEYIQFSIVFLISSIFCISFVLAEHYDTLIFWQLTFTTRNLTYFIFFIHVSRMLWKDPPFFIFYSGIIMYSIIQFFIFIWQSNPNGVGAGLYLFNGVEVFSTDFRLLSIIFQILVALTFFYGFYAVQVLNPSNKLKVSRIIMIIMSIMLFATRFYRLLQILEVLPESNTTEVLGSSILVVGFLIMGGTFLYDPSAILLSRVQVGGIMVIADSGTPVCSLKFKEGGLSISPTLMSGIISAIDNVVFELSNEGNEDLALQEIQATNRVILIDRIEGLTFSIITNEASTSLLQSSLKYFGKLLLEELDEELNDFRTKGQMINLDKLEPLIARAFPYSQGLTLEQWH